MNKSDFLDELRLEIGLAYDYAKNRDDFVVRVLKTIHAISKKKVTLTIHTYKENQLSLIYALGIKGLTEKQKQFGIGFLFGSQLHAVSYIHKDRAHVLFLPIYEQEELVYVITIRLIDSDYKFTKQDMIFANELVHFIESKRSLF
ncbi:hypothetical protein CR194_08855 [Salipaludibacillus keqinensis]|uniref:GAF domain-containing protein n=1 Tax=Salipaludibacillus keqinensis TaxID=2045207 RepID=A0A323TL63_9BACI|nr:hypothetical protein [Salipaludibacillus keqinensis]PYZ93293.1 hypothetical protein CR194_08855 [Salipaludibacillus keqinensis]